MLATDIFLLKNVRLSVQLLVFFSPWESFPRTRSPYHSMSLLHSAPGVNICPTIKADLRPTACCCHQAWVTLPYRGELPKEAITYTPKVFILLLYSAPGVNICPKIKADLRFSDQVLDIVTRGEWPLCDPGSLHFGPLSNSLQHPALQTRSPVDNTIVY